MAAETTHPAPLPRTKVETDLPKIFVRAAVVLIDNGHYKGDYYNTTEEDLGTPANECGVCAHGALNIAAGGDPDDITGLAALAAMALADHLGIDSTPAAIGAWNDRPEQTRDGVVTVFCEIAIELSSTTSEESPR